MIWSESMKHNFTSVVRLLRAMHLNGDDLMVMTWSENRVGEG